MARARRATNQRRVWSERKAWGLTRKKREKFKVKRAGRTVAWQSRALRLGMGRDATGSGLRHRLTRTTAFVTKRTVHSTPQHSCTTPRTTRHALHFHVLQIITVYTLFRVAHVHVVQFFKLFFPLCTFLRVTMFQFLHSSCWTFCQHVWHFYALTFFDTSRFLHLHMFGILTSLIIAHMFLVLQFFT